MNDTLVDVYFLSGRDPENGQVRSQLPGMDKFYFKATIAKFFAKFTNFWNGVCGGEF